MVASIFAENRDVKRLAGQSLTMRRVLHIANRENEIDARKVVTFIENKTDLGVKKKEI